MKKDKTNTTQEWLPWIRILDNGIVQKDENTYVKVMKVHPINFNLKSILEKETILNSYKLFLKTCNFNIQILIQSNKEDLSKHIRKINSEKNKNSPKIQNLTDKYLKFIKEINNTRKSSNKEFYIITEENNESNREYEVIVQELNEKYFKIKECLSRCGNLVENINNKNEMEKILFSFINLRINNIEEIQ